ncbi:MAG: hypothetical protein H7321_04350 [Bacteroidia bacterium]|nr:hypothetical protein [Bacteroidia bacterium]
MFFLFCMISCQNKKEEVVLRGIEFYPLKTGSIKTYNITSIKFNSFTGISDTLSYDILEKVAGINIDSTGDTTHRIEWYKYDSSAFDFVVYRVFTRKIDLFTAQTIDNNIRYVDLSFPVVKNKTWDGNLYNMERGARDYKYLKIFEPFSINSKTFSETITVREAIESFGLKTLSKYSVYAKNVGLVYREHIDYEIVNTSSGQQREGTEYYIRIK